MRDDLCTLILWKIIFSMKKVLWWFLGNKEKCVNFTGMLFKNIFNVKSIYAKICLYLKKVRWVALIHTTYLHHLLKLVFVTVKFVFLNFSITKCCIFLSTFVYMFLKLIIFYPFLILKCSAFSRQISIFKINLWLQLFSYKK